MPERCRDPNTNPRRMFRNEPNARAERARALLSRDEPSVGEYAERVGGRAMQYRPSTAIRMDSLSDGIHPQFHLHYADNVRVDRPNRNGRVFDRAVFEALTQDTTVNPCNLGEDKQGLAEMAEIRVSDDTSQELLRETYISTSHSMQPTFERTYGTSHLDTWLSSLRYRPDRTLRVDKPRKPSKRTQNLITYDERYARANLPF